MTEDSKQLFGRRRLLLVTVLAALLAGLLSLPDAAGQPPGSAFLIRLLLWQGLIWGSYGLIRALMGRRSRARRFRLGTQHP